MSTAPQHLQTEHLADARPNSRGSFVVDKIGGLCVTVTHREAGTFYITNGCYEKFLRLCSKLRILDVEEGEEVQSQIICLIYDYFLEATLQTRRDRNGCMLLKHKDMNIMFVADEDRRRRALFSVFDLSDEEEDEDDHPPAKNGANGKRLDDPRLS